MDIQSLKRNTGVIGAGKWVENIPGMGKLRVKVRGMKSNAYREKLTELSRAVPASERNADGTLIPSVAIRVTGQSICEAVLLDWDGFTKGAEPLPYDKETALMFCTDPAYEAVLDAFVWAAGVVDNEKAVADEELAKNSPAPSAGTSKKQAAE